MHPRSVQHFPENRNYLTTSYGPSWDPAEQHFAGRISQIFLLFMCNHEPSSLFWTPAPAQVYIFYMSLSSAIRFSSIAVFVHPCMTFASHNYIGEMKVSIVFLVNSLVYNDSLCDFTPQLVVLQLKCWLGNRCTIQLGVSGRGCLTNKVHNFLDWIVVDNRHVQTRYPWCKPWIFTLEMKMQDRPNPLNALTTFDLKYRQLWRNAILPTIPFR